MGDKSTHGEMFAGHVNQCNSVAMAAKRGFKVDTGKGGDDDEDEYDMIRTEHFANRYREHQKSIQFAVKILAKV